jgi:hypothetical protein
MTNLVRFQDGVLFEVARPADAASPVVGKDAERVASAFQAAANVIGTTLRSVVSSLNQAVIDSGAAEAEIEFGVSVSIEGNIYVTKVTGEGSITVKVKVNGRPK